MSLYREKPSTVIIKSTRYSNDQRFKNIVLGWQVVVGVTIVVLVLLINFLASVGGWPNTVVAKAQPPLTINVSTDAKNENINTTFPYTYTGKASQLDNTVSVHGPSVVRPGISFPPSLTFVPDAPPTSEGDPYISTETDPTNNHQGLTYNREFSFGNKGSIRVGVDCPNFTVEDTDRGQTKYTPSSLFTPKLGITLGNSKSGLYVNGDGRVEVDPNTLKPVPSGIVGSGYTIPINNRRSGSQLNIGGPSIGIDAQGHRFNSYGSVNYDTGLNPIIHLGFDAKPIPNKTSPDLTLKAKIEFKW